MSMYRRHGRFQKGQSEPPVCKRCNEPHWPFHRCSNVSEVKENTPVWERTKMEGWSEWGDRLSSYERMGSNLVRRNRDTSRQP